MRRTGLRAIERLQGAKMQQRGPGDRPRGFLRERTPLKKLCLRIEGIQLAAQARTERDGAGVGRAVGEIVGK
ncbi:hypothetical protein D3C71_2080200 [compost metagenome]